MTNSNEDKLAFLDDKQSPASTADKGADHAPAASEAGKEPAAASPAPAATASPAAPNASGQPPVAPDAAKPDGHSVPLPKYLDTYNENRELKKRIAEADQRERERQEKAQAQAPDPALDPQGYERYLRTSLQRETQGALQDQKFHMSEQMARQSLGEATVTAAFEAFQARAATDQFLAARIIASQHPYAEMVKWHKQDKLLSDMGDNPDEWVKRRWAELNPVTPDPAAGAPPAPPQSAPVVMPLPSMSKAPSGAKPQQVPTGPGQGFDSVFGA